MLKKKRKLKKWVWVTILILGILCLAISFFKIVRWYIDNKNTATEIQKIDKEVQIKKVTEEENVESINPPEASNKPNDYWDYIKLPLINVDFTSLLQKNPDTVAFIKVSGTNINYPVVQSTNNSYYLNHSYDKSYNEAGWVFLDYRNDLQNFDSNTIIYAHGRYDTTMFGSLKNVFKNNWYKNTENYVINLSTPIHNTLWQIFSVYIIDTENYYLTTNFASTENYQAFLDTISARSMLSFNASVNTNDKILTLSTCYNNFQKVVLHAKLIKIQKK